MLKVLRELLVGIIDDIDTGNTNIEEEDEVKIIESLRQYTGHLAMHIAMSEDIDPFGEEYQYLTGAIGKKMFKAAKLFMCDSCRTKLTEIIGEG